MIASQPPQSSQSASLSRSGSVVPAGATSILWLGLFIVALALLGGSSRPDPMQNAALRPIAALLLIPALYRLRAADLASAKAIIGFGGLLLVWMIVQLVPLPPALWQALPGGDAIAQLDQLAGVEGIWRPLALAPFRGLNAALGMLVPITALLLMLSARLKAHSIFLILIAIGLINSAFGILQVLGGPDSILYLFTITNRGAPAGIFANENHSAVFSSIVLLVIARLAIEGRSRRLAAWIKLSLAPACLVILLAVMLSGSRAGFATTALALGAAGAMFWSDFRSRGSTLAVRGRSTKRDRQIGLALLAAGGAAIILVIVAFLLLGRTPAAQDLTAIGAFEDVRWSFWPILQAMMSEHWMFGTGFGSFDVVYRIYEPTDLLFPLYVNHAHNDWAQLVIEGGLPAIACLLGLTGWLLAAILRIARRHSGSGAIVVFWIAVLAIIMAASAVDYPLRTPIFQAMSVWLLLCLARDRAGLNSADDETDRS